MDSNEVLLHSGFGLSEELLKEAPAHLTDKMIVDLVNGIEVIDDQIKVSKTRTSKFERFRDSFSGRSKHRQDLINDNLAKCMDSTRVWLQNHDYEIASINLAITKITDKLLETRSGVMQLNSKHNDLADSVINLAKAVDDKNEKLFNYIRDVDLRTRADRQLDRVIAKWQAGGYRHENTCTTVYMVLDDLKNNDFGLYLECGSANFKDKQVMLLHLKDALQNQLCNELSISSRSFHHNNGKFSIQDLAEDLARLNKANTLSLNYLSDWSNKHTEPNTWLLHQLTEDSLDRNNAKNTLKEIPSKIRVNRWFNRITDENIHLRGTQHGR